MVPPISQQSRPASNMAPTRHPVTSHYGQNNINVSDQVVSDSAMAPLTPEEMFRRVDNEGDGKPAARVPPSQQMLQKSPSPTSLREEMQQWTPREDSRKAPITNMSSSTGGSTSDASIWKAPEIEIAPSTPDQVKKHGLFRGMQSTKSLRNIQGDHHDHDHKGEEASHSVLKRFAAPSTRNLSSFFRRKKTKKSSRKATAAPSDIPPPAGANEEPPTPRRRGLTRQGSNQSIMSMISLPAVFRAPTGKKSRPVRERENMDPPSIQMDYCPSDNMGLPSIQMDYPPPKQPSPRTSPITVQMEYAPPKKESANVATAAPIPPRPQVQRQLSGQSLMSLPAGSKAPVKKPPSPPPTTKSPPQVKMEEAPRDIPQKQVRSALKIPPPLKPALKPAPTRGEDEPMNPLIREEGTGFRSIKMDAPPALKEEQDESQAALALKKPPPSAPQQEASFRQEVASSRTNLKPPPSGSYSPHDQSEQWSQIQAKVPRKKMAPPPFSPMYPQIPENNSRLTFLHLQPVPVRKFPPQLAPVSNYARPAFVPSNLPRKETLADDSTCESFPSFYEASYDGRSVETRSFDGRSFDTNSLGTRSHHSVDSFDTRPRPSTVEVAIAPGVMAPLRGAKETSEAVRQNFIIHIICWGCEQQVYCIADCRWAICPCCKTISPLEPSGNEWGLGLGLTREALNNMRQEAFRQSCSYF